MSSHTREWLRRRGVDVIHVKCSQSLKAELKECFKIVDLNDDGSIDAHELFQVFNMLGIPVDFSWCLDLIEKSDEDKSRTLDYGEFERIMLTQWHEAQLGTAQPSKRQSQFAVGVEEHMAGARGAARGDVSAEEEEEKLRDLVREIQSLDGVAAAPMSISLALTNYRRKTAMDTL
eukprot:CAMPEP_0196577994 /NCGR_PEP_ID=MMETSP1081-20130531/6977_1 /TAXON_ID=36882 /ORGANISM="Pyramimonas amylifera, Strain CCMP720" /LENGTH=174 /DNA_ID=CAMNT_0041897077 /DNA_START=92 /DNA_END=613 /DNA_ORIENTATION=+